ncbi:MAG: hypothetical protein QM658_12035 [Gordonia sp. (in: high G+C Gram-positive bacteria)]
MGEVAMPFVSYLNRAFASGGFPERSGGETGGRIRRELAEDLLPL